MARSYRDIRAWQAARAFKRGIYTLISEPPLSHDIRLATQLREAAASAQSNISEGFGRFDPADFARLVKVAKASIIECQNHLEDGVDRGELTEQDRRQHDDHAREALREIGGLLDYLQSPEAKRNAERLRQARFERRRRRVRNQPPEPGTFTFSCCARQIRSFVCECCPASGSLLSFHRR
jgi:four helix bundle protein